MTKLLLKDSWHFCWNTYPPGNDHISHLSWKGKSSSEVFWGDSWHVFFESYLKCEWHWIPGQPGADLFSCGKDNHQGGFRLESVHSSLKCMQFAYLRFSFLCQDFRLMGHRKWWKPIWMQKKPANMRNCCLNHSYKTDATQTPPGNVLSFVSTCCPLGLPKTGWSCCAVLPKRRATDYTSCKLK